MVDDYEPFQCYSGGGAVIDAPPELSHRPTTHVVSLVGWGEEGSGSGPYWVARHSGGRYWGDNGFFYIRRGNNTLRIEEFCYWGTLSWPPQPLPGVCTD